MFKRYGITKDEIGIRATVQQVVVDATNDDIVASFAKDGVNAAVRQFRAQNIKCVRIRTQLVSQPTAVAEHDIRAAATSDCVTESATDDYVVAGAAGDVINAAVDRRLGANYLFDVSAIGSVIDISMITQHDVIAIARVNCVAELAADDQVTTIAGRDRINAPVFR